MTSIKYCNDANDLFTLHVTTALLFPLLCTGDPSTAPTEFDQCRRLQQYYYSSNRQVMQKNIQQKRSGYPVAQRTMDAFKRQNYG
jgi:hypothetical protein